MSIQMMLLGVGAVATKTYVDDVFSTFVYSGNSTARSINNSIDLSGEGGMLWVKRRNQSEEHIIVDTARGAANYIASSNADGSNEGSSITSFNSTGFSLGTGNHVNGNNYTYASWSFRKAPGFFDVVTYTGDGATSKNISHSLGSIPGMILVKCTSSSQDWAVYNRTITASKYLSLNKTDNANNGGEWFADGTEPTASVFSVGNQSRVNSNGETYVAYIFAGGASTTDKAVELDGTNDYLTIPDNDAWNLGNTFTIEAWVNLDALNDYNVIIAQGTGGTGGWYMSVNSNGSCQFYDFTGSEQIDSAASAVSTNTWTHIAIVANGGTAQWYVNGKQSGSSGSLDVQGGSSSISIGAQGSNYKVNGEISNLRVTKGQALYKANFNVPQDPLTQTSQNAVSSNVKLLCCNGSTATASTVTPDTISATGSPSVTTNNSIFDDPAAHVFGESGSESVIKCGSYKGNGNDDGPEINLGWEPQWVLIKDTSGTADWVLFDSQRGIVTGDQDLFLFANSSSDETEAERLTLTSTGFKIPSSGYRVNSDGNTYIYICIRRPDGYVGKPPELGTDVFAMVMSNGSVYNSGFPVDFAFYRKPAASYDWWTVGRLIQGKELKANTTATESDWSGATFDSNVSWGTSVQDNTHQSWMWKRNAGFDVVTYTGTGSATTQNHSLGKVPEMMWIKNRGTAGKNWQVYHKGMNGGTNPEQYRMRLNSNVAEGDYGDSSWNDTAPTSSVFTVGTHSETNGSGEKYIAMLFASVEGISKVGYYTGTGFSGNTQTLGFQPRFIIQKRADGSSSWNVLDSVRGITDHRLELDGDGAEDDSVTCVSVSSTGFTPHNAFLNISGAKYIYYAHA